MMNCLSALSVSWLIQAWLLVGHMTHISTVQKHLHFNE